MPPGHGVLVVYEGPIICPVILDLSRKGAQRHAEPKEPSEIVVWSVDTASAGASAGTLAQAGSF